MKRRIGINAPVVLGYVGLCVLAFLIDLLTGGAANRSLFSVYRSSLANPLAWLRMFTHVLGHSDWNHLLTNMMYILILGPLLEEKYGARRMLLLMLVVALVTGVVHFLLFPGTMLLGASGIVFSMILLSSITGSREIPLTFILVAVMYIGQQVYEGLFVADNVSQLTHILGGLIGAAVGFRFRKDA